MSRSRLSYLWTLPMDVFLWVVWILPFWMFWGHKLRWDNGSLVFNLKKGSWPSRTWYKPWGGTTLGHAIMYNWWVSPGDRTYNHERHHVLQYRASMLNGFITGLIVFFVAIAAGAAIQPAGILATVIWLSGYLRMAIGGWLAALIETGNFYTDSQHEIAARAVANNRG